MIYELQENVVVNGNTVLPKHTLINLKPMNKNQSKKYKNQKRKEEDYTFFMEHGDIIDRERYEYLIYKDN